MFGYFKLRTSLATVLTYKRYLRALQHLQVFLYAWYLTLCELL